MMEHTWNYRVIRHRESLGEYLQIHEVHYDDGRPTSVTLDGAEIGGDNIDEIRKVMKLIELALDKPVLEFDSFSSSHHPPSV